MQESSSRNQQARNHQDIFRQIATLAAIVAAFAINAISNIFPIGSKSIGVISNTVFRDVLIIPANYAFAIWGLIYLGLFGFGIYQALPSQRQNINFRQAGYPIVLASVAQCVWVYLFLLRLFVPSTFAMVVIAASLITAYLRLEIAITPVSRIRKWLVHLPISIYIGWISVASIVNVACALYSYNWDGWGVSGEIWAVIMVIIATGLGCAIAFRRRDIAYPGVIIWAITAIAVKHSSYPILKTTVFGCSIILAIAIFIQVRKYRPS
jgi:hypothetical protein